MNISHEHKTIWWAQEFTDTKITREVLLNYDFLVYNSKTEQILDLKVSEESHSNEIPNEYSEYKVICNVKNPYDRIFQYFIGTMYQEVLIEKGFSQKLRKNFNIWISKVFKREKLSSTITEEYKIKNYSKDIFSKWRFDEKIPNFFIRDEYFYEDLMNLDFINEDFGQNVKNDKKTQFAFDEMYDFDSAKLVYFYYKTVFNLIPYNPFSFTTESLSDSEKISFLHDIL